MNHKTECQDCTERHIGCHDTCEKYKEFKQRIEHEKQLKREYQEKHGEMFYEKRKK